MESWRVKEKKGIPDEVTALYKLAKTNNCWIYHIDTRIFYTSDEFMENWKNVFKEGNRGESNFKEFAVKNPYAAIKQRAEWIKKANEEMQNIIAKLEAYEIEFKLKK